MATALEFTKNGNGHWEAEIESAGEAIGLEVDRKEKGYLLIYASIGDLDGSLIYNSGREGEANIVRSIDVPEGMTLKIVSYPEVTAGKVTGI